MEIKVLGPGCARCLKLYEETRAALAEAGVAASLSKVERLDEIMAYRVLMTPALVVDGEVKCAGRLPSRPELIAWLTAAAKREG